METRSFNEDQPHYGDPDSSSGCGCFGLFRFKPLGRGQNDAAGEKRQGLRWVREKARKAREVSEVIAGPKWKNFVRKVGGYFKANNNKQSKTRCFQYDPQSYALNFEEERKEEEENGPLLR